ncbi:hypothetical protein SLS54_009798 [Diplodia seriata]
MAVCIPWLLFWMCLRSIVWVLTCGHYGFNDMAKKKRKGNAQGNALEERRAAIESIAQLAEFLDKRNHPGGGSGGANNRRNDVDLEAQDNIQPAARSKTYHEALAEVQHGKPHADSDAIELETMRTDGQGNAKDNLTSEEREAARELEAWRLEAKEAEEAEEKAAKEAEEEAQNRENPSVWPEGSKPAVKESYLKENYY